MNVLHVVSNKKWTERAEPAADLAVAQQALGHDVTFACGRWRGKDGHENSVAFQAREKGLNPQVFHMQKHFKWYDTLRDVPRLRRLIRSHRVDVVHAHMENAQLMSACSARGMASRPVLVTSIYDPEGAPRGMRSSRLIRKHTDGLIVITERARRSVMQTFGTAADRVEVIEPGIQLEVFQPDRSVDGGRTSFGLTDTDFVVGMVTRLRTDRRMDLAIDAVERCAAQCPDLRLLLIGRGEEAEPIREDIKRRGLEGRVFLGGYCRGDRLGAAFRSMNLLVYPVPGTDKSCRTVREAMASGLPVIASRVGFLPDLVKDGVTGCLMDPSVESLVGILRELYANRDRFHDLGHAALAAAQRRFSLDLQARRTLGFYETLMAQVSAPHPSSLRSRGAG